MTKKERRLIRQTFHNIHTRCNYKKDIKYKFYGGRGIKNLLTIDDLTYLWWRDSASEMKQQSIDRIDSNSNYSLKNCRSIEMSLNRKLGQRKNVFNHCKFCENPRIKKYPVCESHLFRYKFPKCKNINLYENWIDKKDLKQLCGICGVPRTKIKYALKLRLCNFHYKLKNRKQANEYYYKTRVFDFGGGL